MSIASEISQLNTNKTNIKAAIVGKNPTVSPTDNLSQWPTSIGSIVELKGETKSASPSTSQQIILPTSGKNGITQMTILPVTSSIDANIVAGNIKKDVSILGVTGSYEGSGGGGSIIVYIKKNIYMTYSSITVDGVEVANDYSGNDDIIIHDANTIRFDSEDYSYGPYFKAIYADGTEPNIPWGTTYTLTQSIYIYDGGITSCMLSGTKIMLKNGYEKNIEDITYDDDLLVWNFDEGKYDSAKPLWIMKKGTNLYYFDNTFDDGKKLLITGESRTGWGHRGLNLKRQSFKYFPASVGDIFMTLDGPRELISSEKKKDRCDFYNIITKKHFNLYANRILTSCSLNNLYPIKDMMFVKDNRTLRSMDEYDRIPKNYYDELRLSENNSDISTINNYVHRLLKNKE